jgi:hypothetical protein
MARLTCDQVAALVSQMRTLRTELPDVEAKDGRNGLPSASMRASRRLRTAAEAA